MSGLHRKPALVLEEMTQEELEAAWPLVECALLPVGSTEQHGPYCTFSVDTARAEGFARLLAARLHPTAIALPVVDYGSSEHHMSFPGTVDIGGDVLARILVELMGGVVGWGLKKLLILNAHGGNRSAVQLALDSLAGEYPEVWVRWVQCGSVVSDLSRDLFTSPLRGHACEGETSQCLYLAPWTVRPKLVRPGRVRAEAVARQRRQAEGIREAENYRELSCDGALGNAAEATEETGRLLVETAIERLAVLVQGL